MKKLLLLTTCWLLTMAGYAQAPTNGGSFRLTFRLGRVVLLSGDTLDGPVALQFGPDLLFLAQADGSVRTFAPAAVVACAVQQEMTGPAGSAAADPNLVRLFRALPWYPDRTRKQPEFAFFEQLGGGPVLLLRRQRLAQRTVAYTPVPVTVGAGMFGIPVGGNSRGLPPPAAPRYLSLPELREDFFLIRRADDLAPLRPGLKDLLGAFPAQAPQLQAYAQAHRLSAGSARELTELVSYANALAASAAP
ncbi:hypothetical protein MON38_08495 [Hymenobacter sp. DH14]|uniref:DUF4369 domain-containing protein n=1 Tax=Hymenobacter cyanobacteriorum TaxID=2926463 RepID=A0A9X1VG13_9BACT|nr:hypothetical protein [Hymenobacter cyanobacteriorum]MCI1187458.1 hypothetical protein [Hymenobacter cyanobacteriorum]